MWPVIAAVGSWVIVAMQVGIVVFMIQKDRAVRSSLASLRSSLDSQGNRLDIHFQWLEALDGEVRATRRHP